VAAQNCRSYAPAVEVRLACADDALAVETIRVAGWRTAYRHVLPPGELDTMPIDPSRWQDRFDRPPPGWATFIAEEAGEVTGFAALGPSRDQQRIGELYAIYVAPAAWSKGVGRSLIAAAEAELARSYDVATLWVLSRNPRARRFYALAGWRPDGATQVHERFGVSAEELRYRKQLRPY
jgi:GNAT superfamily N-acetyltransferase